MTTEDISKDLEQLSLTTSSTRGGMIQSLPERIILGVIGYLDLRSIARLSITCRVFYKVARSEELWCRISRALVGPWIHRHPLLSKHIPKSGQSPSSTPPNWTQDHSCFPLSHFAKLSTCPPPPSASEPQLTSWYKFASLFLIPHFQFLGWHISNRAPECEIILVTYDIYSGGLIFEKVKCLNFFDTIQERRDEWTRLLGLPGWVPTNRIQFESEERLQYRISAEDESSNQVGQEILYEMFIPMYSFTPLITISPFESQYMTNLILPRKVYDWDEFLVTKSIPQIRHAEKIITPRSDIRFRVIMNDQQGVEDLVSTLDTSTKRLLETFIYSRGVDRRSFFPTDGPTICTDHKRLGWGGLDEGLWVGISYCTRGQGQIDFGKFVLEKQANSHHQLRFLRLTGGGRPEFIWHLGLHHGKPVPALSLDHAFQADFGTKTSGASWLSGQARNNEEGEKNGWQMIKVQFIKDPETQLPSSSSLSTETLSLSEKLFKQSLNVNHIRVKWSIVDQLVSNYFRVQFH